MATFSSSSRSRLGESASSIKAASVKPTFTNPTGPQDFMFDSGNIRIMINCNGEVIEGKASSDALCLASPVWKKFLFPPWQQAEELRHSVKQIDCTGDNAEALLILLNICHLKMHKIPQRLAYHQLLQVAVLCDQYDCVHIVKPWLTESGWLPNEARVFEKRPRNEDWLFITWVFGMEGWFEILALEIWLHFKRHEIPKKDMTPMPPNIIGQLTITETKHTNIRTTEQIISCREQTLDHLLNVPYEVIDACAGKGICVANACESECNAITAGSVVIGLQKHKLFPRPKPQDLDISVAELQRFLKDLQIHRLSGKKALKHSDCCNEDLKSEVDEVLRSMKSPVLDEQLRHMAAQKKRLSS